MPFRRLGLQISDPVVVAQEHPYTQEPASKGGNANQAIFPEPIHGLDECRATHLENPKIAIDGGDDPNPRLKARGGVSR
jgi:hypothetical protein